LLVAAAERLPAIRNGKADLECSNTTNRADRRAVVAFSAPHFIGGARVMTANNEEIRYIDQLDGKRVAVLEAEALVKVLEERNEKAGARIQIVKIKETSEGIEALNSKKVDAWINDDVPLFRLRAQAPNPKAYTISSRVLTIEPLGITMAKDDTEFNSLVNRELKDMMRRGEVTKLYDKWFKAKIPPQNINLDMTASVLLRAYLSLPDTEIPSTFK
jgi:ABC-type amino acid transport substrate-binding protein